MWQRAVSSAARPDGFLGDQGDRRSIFDQFGNGVQVMVWCRVVDVQYGQAKAYGR
jgi:hypothetical protein